MSADNWDTCPRCLLKAKEDDSVRKERSVEAYGKVSADEYKDLLAEAARGVEELDDTLREDHELGLTVDGLLFIVYYKAHCITEGCGFTHDFEYKEPVSLIDD